MQPAIVVTGASSGLGAEFAKLAAGEGSRLVLIARSAAQLEALAASIDPGGSSTLVIPVDLAAPAAGDIIARELAARGLYCDILVNNAGFGLFGEAGQLDRKAQNGIIDVNVRASTELILRFLPAMAARGRGHILNVASVAAFAPGPRMAVYFASKAYLLSLSQALTREVRGCGVSVTCLCPGPLKTPFLARAGADKTRLFKGLRKLNASDVARAGWDAMKAGRVLCVPGIANKTAVMATRFLPRAVLLAIVGRLQRNR
jgi:uncharacterized protein